ncbi:MAG: hypothetical protein OEY11_01910 [Gammaproteobacteria bacterium]|nr:hypothetical protein [Gammaproteobacteria bacterium]
MQVSDIEKIRIDIQSEGNSALSLMISRIGDMMRQGNGNFPANEFVACSDIDPNIFLQLIEGMDNDIFNFATVYDHPDKSGLPITYSIAFQGKDEKTLIFEFRFGTETKDTGELLPYFEGFISKALLLTNDWYALEEKEENQH